MSEITSTYRLQFSSEFTFKQALTLVDYFYELGISHLYASPFLLANPGSRHGYDIVDHHLINPEIGTEEDLKTLIEALKQKGMGLIIDIVPNHMSITSPLNKWWQDVLENGFVSPFADYFDIDWSPPRQELRNKLLLPFLEEPFGQALEHKKIQIVYRNGAFFINDWRTDPKTWVLILDPLQEENEELKSLVTALHHLPSTTDQQKEKIEERLREKESIKKRLSELIQKDSLLEKLLLKRLEAINGNLELLEVFLDKQPYRLAYWRTANEEINYRRFFDVFSYAGLQTHRPEVFSALHALILEWVHKKWIDGLRIDHVDGLLDPEHYLVQLAGDCPHPFYVVIEKILMGNETLPTAWPIDGTVGYDFLNQLNSLFVVQKHREAFRDLYCRLTGISPNPQALVFECKRLVLQVSMASELHMLGRCLDRIAQQDRNSRDFTEEGLRHALRDVIAGFGTYRTYIQPDLKKVDDLDRQSVVLAVKKAKRFNPATDKSIFDFIEEVLLTTTEDEKRANFILRFQQLTGPVMAKGLEDTAFYRYFPLLSLNEVGYDFHTFGQNLEVFHKKNQDKLKEWPRSLIATSTHDTKRSEDVRARLNVLSEIPEKWEEEVSKWFQLNSSFRDQEEGEFIPSLNEEYYLYQTLVGTWPINLERLQAHIEKALREAKIHTSWMHPNLEYEKKVKQFVKNIMEEKGAFLKEFKSFLPKIRSAGELNSLSQVILKLTSPGIPDIYQGNETWDFSLVDPDNRHTVDFGDDSLKRTITKKLLHLRRDKPDLFLKGSYVPLSIEGDKKDHLIAFGRMLENEALVVITTRFFFDLLDEKLQIPPTTWKETKVLLPPEFENKKLKALFREGDYTSSLEETFQYFPFEVFSLL